MKCWRLMLFIIILNICEFWNLEKNKICLKYHTNSNILFQSPSVTDLSCSTDRQCSHFILLISLVTRKNILKPEVFGFLFVFVLLDSYTDSFAWYEMYSFTNILRIHKRVILA